MSIELEDELSEFVDIKIRELYQAIEAKYPHSIMKAQMESSSSGVDFQHNDESFSNMLKCAIRWNLWTS